MPRRIALIVICCLLCVGPDPLSAAEAPPGTEAALNRGLSYIRKHIEGKSRAGEGVLAALALVKAEEPIDSRGVQAVLQAVLARCEGTTYKAEAHHYYTAGLELMLLESIDPIRYREEMQKILAYIIEGQRGSGAWHYPNQQGDSLGDTSITQYAALGLWAAARAGLDVPKETWDRMAAWHLRTQLSDGAFSYHPGESGSGDNSPRATLTVGGASNLLLARLHLHGEESGRKLQPAIAPEQKTGKKFGILEAVDTAKQPQADAGNAQGDDRRYSPKAGSAAIEASVRRAVAWTETRFKMPPDGFNINNNRMYYLYGLERMASLGNFEMLGPHDWYRAGAEWMIATQNEEGAWPEYAGELVGTSFGVLFLTRATAKMLGRAYDVAELGGGLLIGGRGLPDNLSQANVAGGRVKSRPSAGAIDDLLARLEGAKAADVPEVQAQVLEAVRFGDREQLIDQRERLLRLVNDPRSEVRRTAVWALGRGGQLADVPLMIKMLSDADVSVAMEAHNALCVLSRRPLAFGLASDPLSGVAENASEAEKQRAVSAWQDRAKTAWSDWYRRVAPYEERDGLGLFR